MDNARKKYVNIERLSNGDIFALFDSIESNDDGDIENILNNSDTEFVVEDESVISTNTIRKEEIGNQSSSASVPKASIHISSTQNEDETNTLDQDESNSAPATQHTSNQSPFPANQRTVNQSPAASSQRSSNQSPAATTRRNADESSAAVVTGRTSNQSSKFSSPTTVTLPKNTNKQKQNSMIQDKTKKKKVNAPSTENKTNQKKGSVPQDKTKQRRKKPISPRNGNGSIKKSL